MTMEISRHWRLNSQRYTLGGVECDGCGARYFPPRTVCPRCGSRSLHQAKFIGNGLGQVYSYSLVHDAPAGYGDHAPYPVALIRLDDGPVITAQLTDVDPTDVQIGMRVEMVTRRIKEDGDRGLITYGYKFRPMLDPRRVELPA